MTGILSVLGALLILSLLITLHELGHFLAGKALGFCILEFSVGMGPVLRKTEKNGTVYSVRAFPVGGMCRFLGEDDAPADDRSFTSFPVWKRFLTVAAGPITNILLGCILSVTMIAAYGNYLPSVMEISGDTAPAAICGIQPGDIFVAVNGKDIPGYTSAVEMIRSAGKGDFKLTVLRNGTETEVAIRDAFDPESGYNRLGVTLEPVRVFFSLPKSIKTGLRYVVDCVSSTFTALKSVLKGATEQVSGPVGTVAVISQAVKYGFEVVLEIAVIINLSVGIFNLLPLPALDGGRLVFMLVEILRGKPVDPEKEGWVHLIGLFLLFGLMILLTFGDIKKLIG